MAQPLSITSAANPRVKSLVRLRQHSNERRATGHFIIETLRELQRAVSAGFKVLELYSCPERLGDLLDTIHQIASANRITPVTVTPSVLEKIAYRENPQGFLAVLAAHPTTLDQLPPPSSKPDLIIILSGLEKPGNVGAIARTADAAGSSAMFLDAPDFDLYNPNCIRASTGSVFSLPIVCDSPHNLLAWLKSRHITTLALTPEASLTCLHLNMRNPIAFIVGSEDRGLDPFWKSHADLNCSIPMRSSVADSLNVSISAAVMLFEAMRQRLA